MSIGFKRGGCQWGGMGVGCVPTASTHPPPLATHSHPKKPKRDIYVKSGWSDGVGAVCSCCWSCWPGCVALVLVVCAVSVVVVGNVDCWVKYLSSVICFFSFSLDSFSSFSFLTLVNSSFSSSSFCFSSFSLFFWFALLGAWGTFPGLLLTGLPPGLSYNYNSMLLLTA